MCVAADNQITEYVGFRNPSAICVIEPGKSCAILNNDTIDHIDYQVPIIHFKIQTKISFS